ncbi:putative O-methyltransferase BCG_1280c [Nostocoides japonicum T1-X7]|uniref:Putative O-methyltransferase BCG_1280c n=1 Tax=Nostocoides japonicum T1-X7 TaxID=1194083 RepID=A0A077LTJ6_9MICO|nr:O-methyltransferase [Tetrasphaera japonica]CCH76566.1 putative O-methyltransferase BCG_1280c [Tetrasphaera japonica T1-X7]
MSALKAASWSYAEEFVPEDEVVAAARERGAQLGATPVGTGAGAALRLLAAAVRAQSVIEIGTGAGTSGLWLLQGMHPDGVLTTIDVEAEHGRAARQAYLAAGVPHQRTRVITGAALDVLPRMTDGAYDMVVIDADKGSYPQYVAHGIRLLRTGGVLALDNMLWHDRVADPAVRDGETVTLRDLGKALRDDERLLGTLLPVGDGVFAAVKR